MCKALKYFFLYLVADSYEEFQKVLEDRPIVEQTVIMERMIKVNHPSLGNNNRSNLQRLYPYLLQHLNDNSSSIVSAIIFETNYCVVCTCYNMLMFD